MVDNSNRVPLIQLIVILSLAIDIIDYVYVVYNIYGLAIIIIGYLGHADSTRGNFKDHHHQLTVLLCEN